MKNIFKKLMIFKRLDNLEKSVNELLGKSDSKCEKEDNNASMSQIIDEWLNGKEGENNGNK